MTRINSETVLIVDDNLTNLAVLFAHLRSVGFKVLVAENGYSAIKRAQLALPDIILLDILMPGIDGLETCRQLKKIPETCNIPVILMTALTDTETKITGFAAGAVDYITKPAQYEEVAARIHTHLTIRNLQKKLEERLAEREKLVQELDAYAQTVAHDLKAPLALILGFAEILETRWDNLSLVECEGLLGSILRNGRKMQEIIDGLLLLANVRQEEILLTELDMLPLIAEAQARLSPLIEQNQAKITLPESFPAAMGYVPWIEQVWVNLLSNAVKYGGSPPEIVLDGRLHTNNMVMFSVQDNGRGLTPEEQSRIFSPFSRLNRSGQIEGHGLGLSIVERIVAKFGGQTGVTSEPGKGSIFYFTLPCSPSEP